MQARAAEPNRPVSGILQRKCASCGQHRVAGGGCSDCNREKDILQRKSSTADTANDVPTIVHEVLRSSGQPLDEATRAFMEPRFAHDFSQVRVHTDSRATASARAINAFAYTVGRNIVFDAGQWSPRSTEGRRLISHELAHVVQQSADGAPSSLQGKLTLNDPGDNSEREADSIATEIVAGRPVTGIERIGTKIQRACGPSAIGAPTSCTNLQGDIVGERFRFIKNCDDFQPREQARLELFAGTIASGETIEIHGFASLDGDPTFNENLSCARAVKAQSVVLGTLTSLGLSATVNLFNHGATPDADPTKQRSVVISRSGITPPATLPTSPPASTFPDKIMFWFHAFIPDTVAGATPAPGGPFAGRTVFPSPPHPFHRNSCFETDERGFDSKVNASSRVRVVGILDTVAGTLTSAALSDLTFEIDCTSGSLKCKKTPSPSVSVFLIPATLTPTGEFRIAFLAAANDPCVTGSPDLAARGLITIDRTHRTFTFDGTTTFYPAFEMYASFGGKATTVFNQAPVIDSPFALLSPAVNPRSDTIKF
jgi:outer membrane protein OmpA-like peptidoglycan-associated protein